jgi:glycerophosphoryl diester phosphodiesterase
MNCPWPISPLSTGVPIHVESMIDVLRPYSWNIDDEYIDIDFINQMKQLDMPTMVFTVNDKNRARQLKNEGVMGIFTDFPSTLSKFE